MSKIDALNQIIKAMLLASNQPLSIQKIIELTEQKELLVTASLQEIKSSLEEDAVLDFKETSSGYQIIIRSNLVPWVQKLFEQKVQKLSKSLLETLALIAYKQPITRTEIESVRGVSVSTSTMKQLLEQEWVKIVGHRDVPGRPALYATTKKFLDDFSLMSIRHLPTVSEQDFHDDRMDELPKVGTETPNETESVQS